MNEEDQRILDYVEKPFTDARQQAEQIAADSRYNLDHKEGEIRRVMSGAASMSASRSSSERARLEQGIPALKKAAYVSIVPSAEDAQRLAYGRDVLLKQAESMDTAALLAAWDESLDAGDPLAARLYADYLPAIVRQKQGDTPVNGVRPPDGNLLAPSQYEPRAQRTRDLNSTEEQRRARTRLSEVEPLIKRLQFMEHNASTRAVSWNIQGDRLVIREFPNVPLPKL